VSRPDEQVLPDVGVARLLDPNPSVMKSIPVTGRQGRYIDHVTRDCARHTLLNRSASINSAGDLEPRSSPDQILRNRDTPRQ